MRDYAPGDSMFFAPGRADWRVGDDQVCIRDGHLRPKSGFACRHAFLRCIRQVADRLYIRGVDKTLRRLHPALVKDIRIADAADRFAVPFHDGIFIHPAEDLGIETGFRHHVRGKKNPPQAICCGELRKVQLLERTEGKCAQSESSQFKKITPGGFFAHGCLKSQTRKSISQGYP